MNFKSKSTLLQELWPTGAKEKALGSRSALEALEEEKKRRVTLSLGTKQTSELTELEKASLVKLGIEEISLAFNGRDVEKMNPEVKARLNAMPIDTIDEFLKWKECWLSWLKKGIDITTCNT